MRRTPARRPSAPIRACCSPPPSQLKSLTRTSNTADEYSVWTPLKLRQLACSAIGARPVPLSEHLPKLRGVICNQFVALRRFAKVSPRSSNVSSDCDGRSGMAFRMTPSITPIAAASFIPAGSAPRRETGPCSAFRGATRPRSGASGPVRPGKPAEESPPRKTCAAQARARYDTPVRPDSGAGPGHLGMRSEVQAYSLPSWRLGTRNQSESTLPFSTSHQRNSVYARDTMAAATNRTFEFPQ